MQLLISYIIFMDKQKLKNYRQYILELEDKFKKDKKKLDKEYDDIKKSFRNKILDNYEISELEMEFSERYYEIEEIYIGMYRKSTLISLYSFLENFMNTLCKNLYKLNKYNIKLIDFSGKGIVRAKKYLDKVCEINMNSIDKEWQALTDFNKIRNSIIHNNGKLEKNDKTLNDVIKKIDSISILNNYDIKVEREFVEFTIDNIENFIEKLYQEIKKVNNWEF